MTYYLDGEDKIIQRRFYIYPGLKKILFFTGEYNGEGRPIFNNEKGTREYMRHHLTVRLKRLTKEDIKDIIKKSKDKINWLEKGLKD